MGPTHQLISDSIKKDWYRSCAPYNYSLCPLATVTDGDSPLGLIPEAVVQAVVHEIGGPGGNIFKC